MGYQMALKPYWFSFQLGRSSEHGLPEALCRLWFITDWNLFTQVSFTGNVNYLFHYVCGNRNVMGNSRNCRHCHDRNWEGLGIPLPLVAGAILSGAYFGDKLSPLSDSTVLASSLSKVDVLAHVRAMLYLSIPAYVITAILFTVVGFMYGGKNIDLDKVEFLKSSLQNTFDIHIWMLIPAVLVIVLLAMKSHLCRLS